MRTLLWVLQGALAAMFVFAGLGKLALPYAEYAADMAWAQHANPALVNLLGAVELIGALGLILPAATRLLPVLTPIAASGLAGIMAGAVVVHIALGDLAGATLPAGLAVLLAVVAWARFGQHAISRRAREPVAA